MRMKEEKLDYIKSYAIMQFRTRGFSKVTMDEIAAGTGTGKGTLYKYFPSKENLLISSLESFLAQLEQTLMEHRERDLNPMEKLLQFISCISEILNQVNSDNLIDIERNVPKAYHMINEARTKFIMGNLYNIIEEGKSKKFYRSDLDTKMVAHIIIGTAEYMTKPECLQNLPYNLNELFRNILNTIMRGCLTQKGLEHFFS